MPAPIFQESLESKIRRAVVDLVRGDDYFAEKYERGSLVNVWNLRPLIDDESIHIPQFYAQNVPERDALNRMLGQFTREDIHVRCVFIEPFDTDPIADGETTIVDEIVHFERVVEYGSDGQWKGKLYDPDLADPLAVSALERYLNELPPVITRLQPFEQIDPRAADDDPQTVIGMNYPVILSYRTQQKRDTRRTT